MKNMIQKYQKYGSFSLAKNFILNTSKAVTYFKTITLNETTLKPTPSAEYLVRL